MGTTQTRSVEGGSLTRRAAIVAFAGLIAAGAADMSARKRDRRRTKNKNTTNNNSSATSTGAGGPGGVGGAGGDANTVIP